MKFMKNIFILLMLLVLFGCTKENELEVPIPVREELSDHDDRLIDTISNFNCGIKTWIISYYNYNNSQRTEFYGGKSGLVKFNNNIYGVVYEWYGARVLKNYVENDKYIVEWERWNPCWNYINFDVCLENDTIVLINSIEDLKCLSNNIYNYQYSSDNEGGKHSGPIGTYARHYDSNGHLVQVGPTVWTEKGYVQGIDRWYLVEVSYQEDKDTGELSPRKFQFGKEVWFNVDRFYNICNSL